MGKAGLISASCTDTTTLTSKLCVCVFVCLLACELEQLQIKNSLGKNRVNVVMSSK